MRNQFRQSLTLASIGLPPAGSFNLDVNPSALVFKNQSVKGTLVAGLGDVDETLDFARRGPSRNEARK
jgi:propanol-preferring alcohol dehydrogenase